MNKMDGMSMDLTGENIAQLKKLFPEAVTEGKIDFEVLKALLGGEIEQRQEYYKFTWNGKEAARAYARTRSMGTLRPCVEESSGKDGTPGKFDSENLYIEGDNLEVLKLLQGAYHKKVKMIYIDPPYNTGKDFVYPDNYRDSIKNYKELTGQTDAEGKSTRANPETSGRYHTDWLNMMYPRLILARNLLTDDGVIFASIGKEELHDLSLLMCDIFGEEAFKNIISIRRGIKSVQEQFETIDSLNRGHEYLLFFAKNASQRFEKFYIPNNLADEFDEDGKPVEILGSWNNHWRGTDRATMRYPLWNITPKTGQWRWAQDRSEKAKQNYEEMLSCLGDHPSQKEIDDWVKQKEEKTGIKIDLLRLSEKNKPEHYIHPSDCKLASDLWIDLKPNGGMQLKKCMGKKYFDTPKSCDLMKRLIEFSCSDNDIVLDFFSGSASMAQAILEYSAVERQNIHFIMVQLPEKTYTEVDGNKIPKKESLNAFLDGFLTVAEIGKERIRRAAKKIREELTTKNAKNMKKEEDTSLFSEAETLLCDSCVSWSKMDMGFKVFKLDTSNLLPWNPSAATLAQDLYNAVDNVLADRSTDDLLYEILLKCNLPLTLPIEKKQFGENTVYIVGMGALAICLDKTIPATIAEEIVKLRDAYAPIMPMQVVFRDTGFDDVGKANALQILKQAGFEEKSIQTI